ncbi:MAG TPA: polymer-forming cytoskeletal protein [Methylomirabilota bacterium]|jgi:cytoskeletal protein CcmA (bactofilin family)
MFRRRNGKTDINVKREDLTAFIDEGTEIEGKYSFSGVVMLNGKLSGEIASSESLIVGEKGVIHASIRAGSVVVSGEVVGNIVASDRIELRNASRVTGNLEAPVIVVDEGALFEGQCRMTGPVAASGSAVISLKRS